MQCNIIFEFLFALWQKSYPTFYLIFQQELYSKKDLI
jgi:hypothetical protein